MNYYVEKRGANHGLHLVLTLLTCGLWAITGWPIAAIMGRKRTVRGPSYPQMHVDPRAYQQPAQPPHGYPPQQQYGAPPYQPPYPPQQPPRQ